MYNSDAEASISAMLIRKKTVKKISADKKGGREVKEDFEHLLPTATNASNEQTGDDNFMVGATGFEPVTSTV